MSTEEIEPPYIAFNTKKTGNVMTYKALRLIKHRAVEFVAAGNINRPIDVVILNYTTILLANCNLLIEVIQLVGHESVNTTNGYFQRLNHISNILNKDLPFP